MPSALPDSMDDIFAWDVAIPANNEKDFIKIAVKLGLKGLIFLQGKPVKRQDYEVPVLRGLLVKKKDLSRAAALKQQADFLFAPGDRGMFENKHIRFLYGNETAPRKDHTHYRNSGMDQIFAKIARDKDKTVVFDLSLLFDKTKRDLFHGRMVQNRRLCDKYGVPSVVWSFAKEPLLLRGKAERKSFWRTLK